MNETQAMTPDVDRKLTTVFCADVHGYSRLMDADEVATMARLRQYRLAMRGLIADHHGRVVNTWGDAVIAEFASPVEAVRAAVEIQRELATRNHDVAKGHRMRFRIGINLGDVMVEGDDLYGEGVNVAARLQAVADPGGIAISGTTYDQVHTKLGLDFEFLGPQSVKNITEPVPTYRLVLPGSPRRAPPPSQPVDQPLHNGRRGKKNKRRDPSFPVAMIGFFFLINLFTGLHTIWFHWPSLPFLLMLLLPMFADRKDQAGRR